MKNRIFLLPALFFMTVTAWSQQNAITLSGGYCFTDIEDTEISGSGWRANFLYEYRYPTGGKWAQGLSIGYVNITASDSISDYTISSLPVYYAPKFYFGQNKLNGYIKGALGFHSSKLERTGIAIAVEANDFGFAGGAGLGAVFNLNEKIFLNAEYELLWMSNSYYRDGLFNTVSGGLGIRF